MPKIDVYEIVRDRIIAQLDAGVVPWRKPWQAAISTPMNAVSKRPYSGINLFLLPQDSYADNRWLTFKQAGDLGGSVRKGEKSSIVVFWKMLEAEDDAGARKVVPLLRYYNVFNVEQCDGLKLPAFVAATVDASDANDAADAIIANMPNAPRMSHNGGDRAFYRPATDSISLPRRETFASAGGYYSTVFHELAHSTGHSSRLNRHADAGDATFGCEDYGKEELVAEFGAAYLAAVAGIDNTVDNSAAYIASWRKAIKNADRRLLVSAASKAAKAAAYITGDGLAAASDEEAAA